MWEQIAGVGTQPPGVGGLLASSEAWAWHGRTAAAAEQPRGKSRCVTVCVMSG